MNLGEIKALSGAETQHVEELGAPSVNRAVQNREVIRAVRTANQAEAVGPNSELRYSVERDSGRLLIKLVDKVTNEVIRQVPSETVLRLAEAIRNLNPEAADAP